MLFSLPVSDRMYSDMIYEQQLMTCGRNQSVDAELAKRLTRDWNEDVTHSPELARDDAQERLRHADVELAYCLDALGDGASFVLLECHAGTSGLVDQLHEELDGGAHAESHAMLNDDGNLAGPEARHPAVGGHAMSKHGTQLPPLNEHFTLHAGGTHAHESEPDLTKTCAICYDSNDDVKELPCGTPWCKTCFRRLVESAAKDRSLVPLKCCKVDIDPNIAREFLDSNQFIRLMTWTEEAGIDENKMYCCAKQCGQLIDLDRAKLLTKTGQFECIGCCEMMCIDCKTPWHFASTCVENKQYVLNDRASVELAALAKQEGLSQCPRCDIYVELNIGCNHMTCRCGAEFCHMCNTEYLTNMYPRKPACACPLWDEANLIQEEGRRVQNREHVIGRPLQPFERRDIQAQLDLDNINHDECSHQDKSTLQEREFSRRTKTSIEQNRTNDNICFCTAVHTGLLNQSVLKPAV